MFNVNKAIKDSGLSRAEVLRLQKEIKQDYPHDAMLYELHVIRALRVKKNGLVHRKPEMTKRSLTDGKKIVKTSN
jgi:hypothetical protein